MTSRSLRRWSVKILDLTGKGPEFFPDAEFVTEGETISEDGLDLILAGTALVRIESDQIVETLQEWGSWLKDGGELHVQVPSFEWACREALGGRVNPPLWMHLYGLKDSPYRVAFRMEDLRLLLEAAGLMAGRAETRPYVIARAEQEEFPGEMHYVVGIKGLVEEWIE